jgi:hypothetical protein
VSGFAEIGSGQAVSAVAWSSARSLDQIPGRWVFIGASIFLTAKRRAAAPAGWLAAFEHEMLLLRESPET